ncbi:MAG: SpoIIE family protein phosphatase [Treponema sp.]|nr:SpoIIE family protein phosphatase [Treponema sp.]
MEEEVIDSSFFSEDLGEDSSEVKTGFENTFKDTQVGSITMVVEPVSSSASLDVVLEMFEQQPELTAVPIEEDDAVIGVVERDAINKSSGSGFKLFSSKTCGDYVKSSPFTLNTRDFIETVAAKVNDVAIKVETKHIIVLINNRSFYGIMSIAKMNKRLEELRAQDLEKAKEIQQNMLKKNSDTKKFVFDVRIWNKMANAVGGDYYIAKELCDGKYLVANFDVSGKNVSAALLTVTLGSMFSMLAVQDTSKLSPSKLVVMLDLFLKEIVPVGNFITGAICYVDYKAQTVSLFNCGHTNVFAFLPDETGKIRVATLKPTLPPFGMGAVAEAITGSSSGIYKMPVKPGLQIDLYSDGFTDMQSYDGQRYDESRVKAFFGELFKTDVYSAEKAIEKTVTDWTQNSLLPDDITVMNIRF